MRFWILVFGTCLLFVSWSLVIGPLRSFAIYDPLSVPNNKFGVHILDPNEITEAAALVNSSGGDWGYVNVPIRADDRDKEKWQTFFSQARKLHVIPILRLATYAAGSGWVAPTSFDLVDFANFLNEMPWPTKNRYIILFNEPNHSGEWGGQVDSLRYSTLILQAQQIFKTRSEDFFLLSAGLDMSAPSGYTSSDALAFYSQISRLQPEWYKSLDGLSVHAYPNPAFSASPYSKGRFGISSYRYEINFLTALGYPQKPIFITETGTVTQNEFYTPAFNDVWVEPNLVAITPFILFAGAGDFTKFSLLDPNHQPTQAYTDIKNLPKIAGSPLLANPENSQISVFYSSNPSLKASKPNFIRQLLRLIFGSQKQVLVGSKTLSVDIADNDLLRVRGLSGRSKMAEDQGMLFIFDRPNTQTFWMKDMKFGLDIVWINKEKIIGISKNVPPPAKTNGKPAIVNSPMPADKVLELVAGFSDKFGLKVGDSVNLLP